ncbi:MAG: hypothetical protein RLZZ129_2684, partial [Verrucomicrobiota bacterium]
MHELGGAAMRKVALVVPVSTAASATKASSRMGASARLMAGGGAIITLRC